MEMNVVDLDTLRESRRAEGHSQVRYLSDQTIGVLLTNLGTPDGTDYWSMRRYLKEFLSDRRVIETSRVLWWPLLNGVILTKRPGPKGREYAKIWNRDHDESPLKTITRGQAVKLQASIQDGVLGEISGKVVVEWGMRYGTPSIASAVEKLVQQGCDKILLVPLYPQFSAATTATACDSAFSALSALRRQPTLRVAPPYYNDDTYITALSSSIRQATDRLEHQPEVILASFHGMPASTLLMGDPYYEQCQKTIALLRLKMGLRCDEMLVSFQSRFGNSPWLKPYTDATVRELAAKGIKRIAVLSPGFSADCLETIEEIGSENAKYFRDAGGESLIRIDCLNDSEDGMKVIENIVRRELSGWL